MESRSRTFTWSDPAETVAGLTTLPGLEALRRTQAGELPYPPIAHLMGMRLAEIEPGRVVWTAVPGEEHYNPLGTVHAGFATTLLDSAMGCAIHTTLTAGVSYTTVEIKVNYVRSLSDRVGAIHCEGTAIHVGGRLATAEGRIVDRDGNLYAHATTTCLLLRN